MFDGNQIEVDDRGDLVLPALNVGVDFLFCDEFAAGVTFGGVADENGAGAEKKNDFMVGASEVHELTKTDGVAQVQAAAGGVEALIKTKFLAGF